MTTTAGKTTSPLTLILGGTGKTGRRIVDRLADRGVPTRVGSRSGAPPFDWEDGATWAPAVHGVHAAYISYYPDLAVPGSVDSVDAFTGTAVRQGVQKLVLLSGRGEEEAQAAEQVVRQAGVDWTILRASWFQQNFSESYMLDGVVSGELALPVDQQVREPFVDAEDIADVAVAALTETGHAGQLYELTGPRLLTFSDAVQEIADATGREVRLRSMSVPEYASLLTDDDVPAGTVALLAYLFTEVLDGRNESLTDGVKRALGRAPRDFRDYVRDTAATGVWNEDAKAAS